MIWWPPRPTPSSARAGSPIRTHYSRGFGRTIRCTGAQHSGHGSSRATTMLSRAWLTARFANDRIAASMDVLPPDVRETCAPLGVHVSNWLGYTDPPKHTRLRTLLRTTFTPARAQAMEPRIRELTDALLDEVREAAEPDLAAGLAFPLPARVICEILGIPTSTCRGVPPLVRRHGRLHGQHRADPGRDRAARHGELRRTRGIHRRDGRREAAVPEGRPDRPPRRRRVRGWTVAY